VKKSLVLLLVFGAFVFAQMWPWPGPGRTIDGYTYYVDATAGDDGDAGTFAAPFQTIAKVNSLSLSAGESVGFKRGETWRETLTVPDSGAAGNPITFGAYGTGADPIISGADLKTSWTEEGVSAGQWGYTATPNYTMWAIRDNTAHNKRAQGVTAPNTANITSVLFRLSKVGSPTGNIWVEVLDDSAGTPGSVVGQSDNVDVSGLGASAQVEFTFTTPAALTSGIKYYLAIAGDFTLNATDYVRTEGTTSGTPYAGGISWCLNVATWTADGSADRALWFTVNTDYSFSSYYATAAVEPLQAFEDGARLLKVASKAALSAGSFWYDSGNTRIYVRTSGDDAPAGYTIEASARNQAVDVDAVDYIVLRDIEGTKSNSDGIWMYDASHITVSNLSATWNYLSGVHPYGSQAGITDTLISHVTAAHNGANGIEVTGITDSIIDSNIVYLNCELNIHENQDYTAGIRLTGGSGRTTGITVSNNNVYLNGTTGLVTLYQGSGIWIDGITAAGTPNVIVNNNIARDNHFHGLFVEVSINVLVHHNVSYGNTGYATGVAGLEIDGRTGESAAGSEFYHNTMYDNGNWGIRVRGDSSADVVTDNIVKNNIAFGNGVAALAAFGGGENDGTNGSGNVYSYNELGPDATSMIQWGSATYYDTLAAWETASSQSDNLNSDPLFTDQDNGDFTLGAGSPDIEAGLYVSGVSTANPPNIGAK